ncbi:MAG: nucleotidyltransferase domain-containing protein [Methylophilaceae bacterium]
MSLSNALFTKTQQRVLGLLYSKPDAAFYTNQIVRFASMGSGTVTRELARLAEAGVLIARQEGNQLYYQANAENPIYHELLGIVKKTFGMADVLRDALAPLLPKMQLAFVYGSIAKGKAIASSDVDVLVVSEGLAYADVMEILLVAENGLGRKVNPSIYTSVQLRQKLLDSNAFLNRVVEQDKIWIKGSDDDLRKLIQN